MKGSILMINIYRLIDPETFFIRYIGQTIQTLNERLTNHCSAKEKYHVVNWIKSLKKRGLKPIIELIIEVETQKEADDMEILLISYYKSIGCQLTNDALGGKGNIVISDETREKMSASAKTRV